MIRFWGVLACLLLFVGGLQAQDSIQPNSGNPVQVNSTVVTGPSKVLTYAKFVGFGEPTDAHMESVHSVLTRLLASSSASGATTIALEFSVDGTTWHNTYNSVSDSYYRFRVGLGAWSASIPIGSSSGGAGAGVSSLTAGDGIAVSTATGNVVVSVSPSVVVAWANVTDKPDTAIRWPTANEVVNLDSHVRTYFEKTGLLGPQPPSVHWIGRQWLRRNQPYTLDLTDYIFDAHSFAAPNLPSGLTLANGVISGTPDTEQVRWVDITATNADGATTFTLPFIVLRDLKFSTQSQGFAGLTVKDDVQIAAILGTSAPYIHRWNKQGVYASADTVTLNVGEPGKNPQNTTGLAWTGSYWAVLGNVSGGLVRDVIKFGLTGNPLSGTGSISSVSALQGARGLAFEGIRLYAITVVSGLPNIVALDTTTLGNISFGGNAVRNAEMTNPQGIGILNNQFYIVDADANKVFVFQMSDAQRGADEQYREWALHAENADPRGITYLDNYWYVSERGQGLVNDTIFIYPTKELYDASVPNLLSLETTSHGTFSTGDALRVRATFSAPVDIDSDVVLQLEIGNNTREAISVDSATGTTAAVQNDVTVANFYYPVVEADVDSDGISTPRYPFGQTGNIYPHGRLMAVHSLNSGDSNYRVTAPPGLAGLHPNPRTQVNSFPQADWTQTDSTAEDYIKNKPPRFPNSASLERFVWTPETNVGIEYTTERGTAYNQLTLATMQGWQTWNESKDFTSGDTLLVRVHDTAVANLAKAFVRGIGYEQNLGHINSDSDNWHNYNSSPEGGYRYYAFTSLMTASGTAGTAYRELPYDALSGAPTIPGPQVQPDWDATSGLAVILNKPDIEKYQTGQDISVADIARTSVQQVIVTPSASLRAEAEAHGTKPHLSIAVHWRSATNPASAEDAQARISVDADPGGVTRLEDEFVVLPRSTYTVTKASVDMEPGDTRYIIDLERDGEDPNPSPDVEVLKVVWRISLADVGSALTAGDGITIANGRVSVANDGVTTGKIEDDAVTLDKLALSGDPVAGQELYFSGAGLEGGYRFLPEEPTSNSGLRMALTTGTPTLTQLQALSYNADIEASTQQRVGQIVVVRVESGTDTAGHVLVIGEPSASPNGDTALRMLLSDLTSAGTASGFEYLRTSGLTIPATAEIDFYLMSAYAAEQVKDLYVFGGGTTGGGGGGITGVTASPPLTATGTTTRNIVIDSNGITPDLLQADTETEKSAMRTRLGITSGGGGATYVASATQALTNFQSTAPQNPTSVTEKDVDLATLASSSSLGYTHYTLTFEGNGAGTRNGTASMYFLPTGETDVVGNRYYLLTDAAFGANPWPATSVSKDYTGSVVVPIDKTSGKVVLTRTSAAATGVLNFATATLTGRRNTPDEVVGGSAGTVLNWVPAKQSGGGTGGLNATFTNYRATRVGNLVFLTMHINMTFPSANHANLIVNAPVGSLLSQSPGQQRMPWIVSDDHRVSIDRRNTTQFTVTYSNTSAGTREDARLTGFYFVE